MTGRYFDVKVGLLPRFVFGDEKIYQQEIEYVFAVCWLFVGPESWLLVPGDFVTTTMGEVPVIVWRGRDGELGVFLNECRMSMAPLTAMERGNAESLVCTCHGWPYTFYRHVLEAPVVVLARIPRVETYKGLVFACFDADAPALADYLGDFAFYLDMLLDRSSGGIEATGEAALRWAFDANWKLPVEAYFGDMYREATLHAANLAVEGNRPVNFKAGGYQVSAGAGGIVVVDDAEVLGLPESVREDEEARRAATQQRLVCMRASLTPLLGAIFPNLTFDGASRAVHVWHPRGPYHTEVRTYCLVDRDASSAAKESLRRACQFYYGPTGLKSEDETVPWQSITSMPTRGVARDTLLNLQMGLGRERYHEDLPGRVSDLTSEMNQRFFYYRWQRLLNGERAPQALAP
jgi:phenylpropionate dioxygenase-like ring-hydroxylating dioxygenase large terminal subunit